MRSSSYVSMAVALVVGLLASSCSSAPHPGAKTAPATITTVTVTTATAPATATPSTTPPSTTTAQTTTTTTTTTTTDASAQLQSLIPVPANARRTDGPDSIPDNGIHMHFMVNGDPNDVMNAYKTELEGKGWTVTVINTGGGPGGSGATYTGTQNNAYGVFTGGGWGARTNINACAWPSKPSNPNCGGRH